MKRIIAVALAALGFVWIAAGRAAPRKPVKSLERYMISVPLVQLRRWGLRPQEIIGRMGTLVVDKGALLQLQVAGLRTTVLEIAKIPLPEPFLSPQEIDDELKRLATTHSDRAEYIDLNQRFKTALTSEGRSLKALRIRLPLQDKAPRPIVVLDSLHHARELITPLVTMDAARQLLTTSQSDAQVAAWLKHYEIWIVPIVNPDGYQFVFTKEPYWRKNRRPHPDGSYGVDLNRNYPYLWGDCGKHSATPRSEVFKGLAAASEPEVQTMVAMGEALRPHMYLTYHSYGNEIIRPYMCKVAAEEVLLQDVTQHLATASGYGFRKASSSGESFEHFYALYGSLAFLVEIGRQFHPEVSQIPSLVSSARKTWRALLARGMKAAVRGTVKDESGQPVKATLSIDEIAFKAGEIRQSHPISGSFYWIVKAGTYTFRVQAPGYQPWSRRITVPAGQPLSLAVTLRRANASEGLDSSGEPLRSEERPPRTEPLSEPSNDGEPTGQGSDATDAHSRSDGDDGLTDQSHGPGRDAPGADGVMDQAAKVPPTSSCHCQATTAQAHGFFWIMLWLWCLGWALRRHLRLARSGSRRAAAEE